MEEKLMKTYHVPGKAPYYTNCYLLTDDSGRAVLIDCSADLEKIKKILSNDRCELKAVLLTHGHEDHRETLDEVAAEFGCPVYLGGADSEFFGLENTLDYTDGGKLTFGEMTFITLVVPGHTPGGYILYCEDMMFCGDTLFAGTVGRTDLPGGDFDALMQSLKKILDFTDGEYKVLPGHSAFSSFVHEKNTNYYLLKAANK